MVLPDIIKPLHRYPVEPFLLNHQHALVYRHQPSVWEPNIFEFYIKSFANYLLIHGQHHLLRLFYPNIFWKMNLSPLFYPFSSLQTDILTAEVPFALEKMNISGSFTHLHFGICMIHYQFTHLHLRK